MNTSKRQVAKEHLYHLAFLTFRQKNNIFAENKILINSSMKTKKTTSFHKAVAECQGMSIDLFFEELDNRIKQRSSNKIQTVNSKSVNSK